MAFSHALVRQQVARIVAHASHAQAPELLHLMMNDTNPLLRAQAIAWASRGMTASTVALVVERLADPSALVRLAAQDAVRVASAKVAGDDARAQRGSAVPSPWRTTRSTHRARRAPACLVRPGRRPES